MQFSTGVFAITRTARKEIPPLALRLQSKHSKQTETMFFFYVPINLPPGKMLLFAQIYITERTRRTKERLSLFPIKIIWPE
jgi:hypothetical protein